MPSAYSKGYLKNSGYFCDRAAFYVIEMQSSKGPHGYDAEAFT